MKKTSKHAQRILLIILAAIGSWIVASIIDHVIELDLKKKADQLLLIERNIKGFEATASKLKAVQQDLQDKTESAAVEEITTAIMAYYMSFGVYDKDRNQIRRILLTAAAAVDEAYATGYFKYFAADKTTALQQLFAEIPIESNFNENCVGINKCKKTGKELSRDYGLWQVNSCNLDPSFKFLMKLGLWQPSRNEWTLHVRTNCLMRLSVDEERTRLGWDKAGAGHWHNGFLKILKHIKGWDQVFLAAKNAPGSL